MRGNTERVASREVRARGGVPVGDADDERCFLDESRLVYPEFLARRERTDELAPAFSETDCALSC
jgi:hypothetical protein